MLHLKNQKCEEKNIFFFFLNIFGKKFIFLVSRDLDWLKIAEFCKIVIKLNKKMKRKLEYNIKTNRRISVFNKV
jgi:hypothetical protein